MGTGLEATILQLEKELAYLKARQRDMVRSEGARLVAIAITRLELCVFTLIQVGGEGYELQ